MNSGILLMEVNTKVNSQLPWQTGETCIGMRRLSTAKRKKNKSSATFSIHTDTLTTALNRKRRQQEFQ